ncbi:MAG: hypothetical protein ACRBBK_08230 [Paracoccaceae bacterium]
MRKFTWISLRKLKSGELSTTLRLVHPGQTNLLNRYRILGEIQQNSTKTFSKFFVTTLLLVLILWTNGSTHEITFTLDKVEVSVPNGIISFTTSLFFFFSVLYLQNLFVVMSTKIRMGGELSDHVFSLNAFDLINENNDLALSAPIAIDNRIKDPLLIRKLLGILYSLGIILALWPITIVFFFLVSHQLDLFSACGISWIDKLSAGGGLTLLGISAVYFLFFNLPLPLSLKKPQT